MLRITHHSGKRVAINYEQVVAIESDEQGHGVVILAGVPAYLAQETAAQLEAAMDAWYHTTPPVPVAEGKSKK